MSCTMCSGQGRHERGCPAWGLKPTQTGIPTDEDLKRANDFLSGKPLPMKAVYDEGRSDLRDRFAMAALQGMLSGDCGGLTDEQVARNAYDFADAMLKARDR